MWQWAKLIVVLFFIGAAYCAGKAKGDQAIAEFKAQAAQELQQAQAQAAQAEKAAAKQVEQVRAETDANIQSLNEHYAALLNSANAMRVQQPGTSGTANNNVPGNTEASAGAGQRCDCKSHGSIVQTDRALEVGRDCDALALRYNSLLKIYRSLRNGDQASISAP